MLMGLLVDGRAKRLAIRGPSGTGKTCLAQSFSNLATGSGCTVMWLRGDAGRTEESFYPIHAVLRPTSTKRWLGRGARLVEGLVEDFLPRGKATAKAFISLLPQDVAGPADERNWPNDAPHDFTSLIARLIRHDRLLLVADDLQYFDLKTLALLERLLQAVPLKPKDGSTSLTLLVTVNTEFSLPEPAALAVALLSGTTSSIDLAYCRKMQFGSVLRGLGLKAELPTAVIDLLYDCSGGHLHIANFIVDELKAIISPLLDADSAIYSNLLHFVIQRRLGRLQTGADALEPVLCSAAHIGRSFMLDELICLTGLQGLALRDLLGVAACLNFIEPEGDQYRFTHEIVRTYFLERAAQQRTAYSGKYAECLRILRPHDYFARYVSLFNAGEAARATVAYCQALISNWRAGSKEFYIGDAFSTNIPDITTDTKVYLAAIRQAHVLLANGDFRTAQVTLTALHDGMNEILLAERDYLLAEALLKDLGAAQTEEARRILSEWGELKSKEPELWCRMHLLLLLADVQLGRFAEARQTERAIVSFLASRGKFDYGAERQLRRLLAISEMHSAGEIAQRRIRQACAFYERELAERGFTDFYEYFICLTNCSGNAITTGNYAGAIQEGIRALMICRDYEQLRFPARWAAANNIVIAAVLDGRMPAAEGAKGLRELSSRFPRLDDDLLLNANIGALEILAGRLDLALDALSLNLPRLQGSPDIDPYYRYHSESNRAIALHLTGAESGVDLWKSCALLIPNLAPACRADLQSRHDVVSRLFNVATFAAFGGWLAQALAIESRGIRFRQDRFPEGVFLSDIQIWSSL